VDRESLNEVAKQGAETAKDIIAKIAAELTKP